MGTAKLYAGVSSAVCCYMSCDSEDAEYMMDESDWADEINEDYNRRGRKAARR